MRRSLSRIAVAAGMAWSAASAQERPRGTVVVSNMNDNTATILDAESGRTLATLPTGEAQLTFNDPLCTKMRTASENITYVVRAVHQL